MQLSSKFGKVKRLTLIDIFLPWALGGAVRSDSVAENVHLVAQL